MRFSTLTSQRAAVLLPILLSIPFHVRAIAIERRSVCCFGQCDNDGNLNIARTLDGPNSDKSAGIGVKFETRGIEASKRQIDCSSPVSTAPVAPTSKLSCNGVDNTKGMGRDALKNVIPTFCEDAEKQGVQDKDSGSLVRSYNEGGPDAVTLSMDWPSGADFKPKEDDCIDFMSTVMDSCDGNDPDHNPLNWKHGGNIQVGDVRYNVVPAPCTYTRKITFRGPVVRAPAEATLAMLG